MKKVFEKIIEKLEEEKMSYFLTIANTGDEKLDCAYEHTGDALEKAIEIVKQEAEQYKGGWIPCSKRMPDKNGMYLCTQNSYDLATNKNIIRVSTELVEFYNGKWRRAKNLVVTHWQPLPEPCKERD